MQYTVENFETLPNVSRETLEDFNTYHALIIKWQKAVNLVSPSTIDDIWHRHFADSVGLYNLIPTGTKTVADIGSGGGFPAVVCGILAKHKDPNLHITMIESDQKKCMFLKECVRILNINATVTNERVEKVIGQKFDLMTARALADLATLLTMANGLSVSSALLLKGEKWREEVFAAQSTWAFDYTDHESVTNDTAKILHMTKFAKV